MTNFLRYAIRETLSNLWRNRLMTMAAVLTVTVSLGLVGSALYLKQGAAQASASWQRETKVQVYMLPTASTQQINAVHADLASITYITDCQFHSRKANYLDALRTLPKSESFSLTVAKMPSSFWCTPVNPALASSIVVTANAYPGVMQAIAPEATIHAIENTVTIMQFVFVGIALVLLLSALVLILNTIRMAIFARRREVSVMKLVGATNWFIRIPFIAEGMIQGIIGALFASLAVYGIHVAVDNLSNSANSQSLAFQMRLTGWQVFATDAVIVVIGAAIGAIGSAVAVRRFLDV